MGMMDLGGGSIVKSLYQLNDSLLASGAQTKDTHAMVARSIVRLEGQLQAAAESEQFRVLKEWLEDLEKKAPKLVVALGHVYLDSFKGVKLAKAFAKEIAQQDTKEQTAPGSIDGWAPDAWEQKIHAAFPELRGY